MQKSKEENKRTGKTNPRKKQTYSFTVMFYKFKLDKDPIHTSFRDRKGRPLIPVYFQPKTASVQTTKSIEDLVNKRIFQYEKDDKFLLKRLMKLIMSDPHMAEDLRNIFEYIVCVVIN